MVEFISVNHSGEPVVYLYVKQHSITGLKYFGKTIKRDPIKYQGSGTRWTNHIKKHGKSSVQTLNVWSFSVIEEATEFALKFSADNNIVNSDDWANQIPENALNHGIPHTAETRKRISESNKGKQQSAEHKRKLSAARKGLSRSDETRQKMRDAQLKYRAQLKTL